MEPVIAMLSNVLARKYAMHWYQKYTIAQQGPFSQSGSHYGSREMKAIAIEMTKLVKFIFPK